MVATPVLDNDNKAPLPPADPLASSVSHRRLQQGGSPDPIDQVGVALDDFAQQASACATAAGLTTAFVASGATAAYIASRKNRVGVAWKNKVSPVPQWVAISLSKLPVCTVLLSLSALL